MSNPPRRSCKDRLRTGASPVVQLSACPHRDSNLDWTRSERVASSVGLQGRADPGIRTPTVMALNHVPLPVGLDPLRASGRRASNPLLRFGRPTCPPSSPRPHEYSVVPHRRKESNPQENGLESVPLPKLIGILGVDNTVNGMSGLSCRPRLDDLVAECRTMALRGQPC